MAGTAETARPRHTGHRSETDTSDTSGETSSLETSGKQSPAPGEGSEARDSDNQVEPKYIARRKQAIAQATSELSMKEQTASTLHQNLTVSRSNPSPIPLRSHHKCHVRSY